METNSQSKKERAICPQIQREMCIGTVNLTAESEQFRDGRQQRRERGGEKVSSLVVRGDRGSAFRWMGPSY